MAIVTVKGIDKCLDVRNAAIGNGTPVQMYACPDSSRPFVTAEGRIYMLVPMQQLRLQRSKRAEMGLPPYLWRDLRSGTDFCLDASHGECCPIVEVSQTNKMLFMIPAPRSGVGLKIWTCLDYAPQQKWTYRGDKNINLRNTSTFFSSNRAERLTSP